MQFLIKNLNVVFPHLDEQAEFEMPHRGYYCDVTVTLPSGRMHKFDFYDPARLSQDIEREMDYAPHYIISTTTIILPEVTKESILAAIERLLADGFFAP